MNLVILLTVTLYNVKNCLKKDQISKTNYREF